MVCTHLDFRRSLHAYADAIKPAIVNYHHFKRRFEAAVDGAGLPYNLVIPYDDIFILKRKPRVNESLPLPHRVFPIFCLQFESFVCLPVACPTNQPTKLIFR